MAAVDHCAAERPPPPHAAGVEIISVFLSLSTPHKSRRPACPRADRGAGVLFIGQRDDAADPWPLVGLMMSMTLAARDSTNAPSISAS